MTNTNDTIDGLLAEFRGYAAGMPPSYHVTMSWADFRKMLDRLDAAHRRELSKNASKNGADFGQLGDAAKLREALEHIVNERGMLDFCHNNLGSKTCEDWNTVYKTLRKWIDEAMSALSAPPRNCDMQYNDRAEMYGAFKDWCNARGHTMDPKLAYDAFDWLLAPAPEKEGGAK